MVDKEESAGGIRFNVRTPANYNPTIAHPLLMVYAPGGQSRDVSERLTQLTTPATAAGFIVAYADHRPLGMPAVEELATLPAEIAKKWCIDEKRVYATGHSEGGSVSLALAILDKTRHVPAAIAPSAAGFTAKDLAEFKCRPPIPVMVLHNAGDHLFPGWGKQTVAWWAACNQCDPAEPKRLDNGCLSYRKCAAGGATLYCENKGSHAQWPDRNATMLEFFVDPARFH